MIRFEHVSKQFGSKKVLDDLSFEIEKGETFVIIGRSGMGKSVTIKHMVRLLSPDKGRIWIGDDLVSEARGKELSRIRLRFGLLFQGSALLQWLTAGDNVGLPLRQGSNMPQEDVDRLAEEKLKLVDLSDVFHKHPSDLSGGMQKRVGLARAIITDPEIILYDEPTSGLDPMTSRTIDALIESLRVKLGVTSVVVTHDLHSALSIGTRIALLEKGKMVEISTPQEFIRSKHPAVRDFLDANFITKKPDWETHPS
ncbi:MAG: ATP-binding cassette domain-containing protein [Kiritimatiellae bacterium]|nr:ATP-binding cassette domain-containing protein [Kiritimatiellia bacterium]MDD4734628.1 ATP-binding cassette domain-containing protein [Kiritimatiellia bacterium]